MSATPSSGPRRRPRSIAVDWHDCAWAPRIVVQFPASARAHPRTTPVFLPLFPQGGDGVKPRGGHAPLRGRGEEADYSRSNPLAPALSPLGRGEGVGGNVKRRPRPSCASQFLAELFFSLAPGFSRVNRARGKWKRFQPFSAPAATKPLKRLGAASPAPTGLKPGANERLQESEMRPRPSGRRQNGCLWPPGFCILFVSTRLFLNP